jgi:macrolide transport system ATP-binding/permease protein
MVLLKAQNLAYAYGDSSQSSPLILKDVSLEISQGELIAIQGPSGSGKSTLFYLLGLLATPKKGSIWLDGYHTSEISSQQLAFLRNTTIGFVFQQFHLVMDLSVLDNILLPAQFPMEEPRSNSEMNRLRDRAQALAYEFGLTDQLSKKPNQLSGGQQQRVAIARALLLDPPLILADEPTGNLDPVNADKVMQLFEQLHARGKTICIITHDQSIADRCKRSIQVAHGTTQSGQPLSLEPFVSSAFTKKPSFSLRAWAQLVILSLKPLTKIKPRTLFTMLGILMGVAGLVLSLTLARFASKTISRSYESLGVNKLSFSSGLNTSSLGSGNSTRIYLGLNDKTEIEPLYKIFPWISALSKVMSRSSFHVTLDEKVASENATLLGVDNDFFLINNLKLSYGEMFSFFHVKYGSPVCIVGTDLVKQGLAPQANVAIALGKYLTLSNQDQNHRCKIIGILEEKHAATAQFNIDTSVFTTYRYFKNSQAGHLIWSNVWAFDVQVASGTDIDSASAQLQGYFNSLYGLGSGASSRVYTNAGVVTQMKNLLLFFTCLLGSLSALCLVIAAVGITNIRLVTLSEQIKELGLKKALGASHESTFYQILLESIFQCGAAGILGIGIGFFIAEGLIALATRFIPQLQFEWIKDPWALTLSLLVIILVGVLSALIPAAKAKHMQIIDSLR